MMNFKSELKQIIEYVEKHKLDSYFFDLSFIKQLNLYNLQNSKCILQSFYIDIVSNLNFYLCSLSQLEYLKLKCSCIAIFKPIKELESKTILSFFSENVKLKNFLLLEKFILLVIKLLLYYLWSFEGTYKNKLFINTKSKIQILKYKCSDKISTQINLLKKEIESERKNSYISIFDIQHKDNAIFYDKFYIYTNLLPIYDNNNNNKTNESLNFHNYNHIEKYMKTFLSNLIDIKIRAEFDWAQTKVTEEFVQHVIKLKLNNYKKHFFKEWQSDSHIRKNDKQWISEKMEDLEFFIKQQL